SLPSPLLSLLSLHDCACRLLTTFPSPRSSDLSVQHTQSTPSACVCSLSPPVRRPPTPFLPSSLPSPLLCLLALHDCACRLQTTINYTPHDLNPVPHTQSTPTACV